MPVEFRIDPADKLVITKFYGAVSAEDFLEQPKRLLALPGLPKPLRQLIDARESTSIDFGLTEIAQVTLDPRQVEAFAEFEPVRVAIVAETPVSFGLARMFQGFAEHVGLDIAVYRDEAAARAYLTAD